MATAGSGDFSPTVARGGGEEWGCGGVQEEEGSVLIASKASGGQLEGGAGLAAARPRSGAGREQVGGWLEEEDKVGVGWAEVGFAWGGA